MVRTQAIFLFIDFKCPHEIYRTGSQNRITRIPQPVDPSPTRAPGCPRRVCAPRVQAVETRKKPTAKKR